MQTQIVLLKKLSAKIYTVVQSIFLIALMQCIAIVFHFWIIMVVLKCPMVNGIRSVQLSYFDKKKGLYGMAGQ